MRVQLVFLPAEGAGVVSIPQDFRRCFISTLKSLTCESTLFERYQMDKPGYAPFGMSIEFAKALGLDRESRCLQVKAPVVMNLSSGDMQIFTDLCNSGINKQGDLTALGMSLARLELLPPVKLGSGRVQFKTQGHMVLPSPNGYLGDDDRESLEEAMNYHLFTRADYLRQQWGIAVPEMEPLRLVDSENLHRGVCLHYGGYLTTLTGAFTLEGNAPTLQFVYDYGLGARNGQGFGLLGVINKYGY
jgi:CRISPR-associated endoribonuclease Cas6